MFRKAWSWVVFIVVFAAAWAVIGALVVLAYPKTLPILTAYLSDTFKNIFGDTENLTSWQLAVQIFRQNLKASALDLFSGFFFGLLPALSIAFNFFILGFLSSPFMFPGRFLGLEIPAGTFGSFLLAILPHGIFELPALFLAAAFGLRWGLEWMLPAASGRRWPVFKQGFFDVLKVLPVVLILLAVAAFMEAFVTARIVR